MNRPIVILEPSSLLVFVVALVVCCSPLRLALQLETAGFTVLVSVAPDTDAQSAFVVGESVVHVCGVQLYYF